MMHVQKSTTSRIGVHSSACKQGTVHPSSMSAAPHMNVHRRLLLLFSLRTKSIIVAS